MEVLDVAIVGGGPAGSTCAAFCAAAGLRTLVLEREKFPREKVCGDCINPAGWPVLQRLELEEEIRNCPHASLDAVEFIAIGGQKLRIDLPRGDNSEIAIKRSLFDHLLLNRARTLGAEIREETTLIALDRTAAKNWRIDIVRETFAARVVVGADGRNSTVARLRNLLPRPERERVALQTHIPLRRARRECNCKNPPWRTTGAPPICSRPSRDVSRATLGQSTRPDGGIVTKNGLTFCPGRAIQPDDHATANDKDRQAELNIRAALTVFDINIAIVIGPTPPGTGVIAFALGATSANATSPTSR